MSTEYDEGVYGTTFTLIHVGYPLYSPTYFSQLPGFYYLTYPLFVILGKSIEAGRLAIFLWSIVGLAGIITFGLEEGSVLISVFCISLLYLFPVYYAQIVTFHPDSLISIFSLLSLLSIFLYRKKLQKIYILVAAFYVAVSVTIKLDISTIPSILFIFLSMVIERKRTPKQGIVDSSIFLVSFFVIFVLLTIPFGLKSVVTESIKLRLSAYHAYPFNLRIPIIYLLQDKLLLLITISASIFTMIEMYQRKNAVVLYALFLWVVTTLFLFLIYRPLMPHHIVFLAIPSALLFSYSLFSYTKEKKQSRLFITISIILVASAVSVQYNYVSHAVYGVATNEEKIGVELIDRMSNISDFVVSDDGLLNQLSGRIPPPGLSDTSTVRILSGELSPKLFNAIIMTYKPKLIISWTKRLLQMKNFNQIILCNHYQLVYTLHSNGVDHRVYMKE